MKGIAARPRVAVSADGRGVVSHAGVGMLRELADLTGLSAQVTAALADSYRGPWTYAPGAVFADLAAAVADGADCIDGVGQRCGDREHVFGPAASTTTMWRLVDARVDAVHLGGNSGLVPEQINRKRHMRNEKKIGSVRSHDLVGEIQRAISCVARFGNIHHAVSMHRHAWWRSDLTVDIRTASITRLLVNERLVPDTQMDRAIFAQSAD